MNHTAQYFRLYYGFHGHNIHLLGILIEHDKKPFKVLKLRLKNWNVQFLRAENQRMENGTKCLQFL